ncbi:hypothetical protein SAMN05660473_03858, partial [Arthrobacter sp. 49Tsu3.1M3]
ISNLGQPCPKHHRLKHASAWTPAGASKDHPPGWTSPAGRHYPSEHQDWEPPHWPGHWEPPHWPEDWLPHIPATDEPGPEPGTGSDQGPPADPDPGLPPDPFPDWHQFTAGHPDYDPGRDPIPETEIELPPDPFPDWHQFTARHPLTDPVPEYRLLQPI